MKAAVLLLSVQLAAASALPQLPQLPKGSLPKGVGAGNPKGPSVPKSPSPTKAPTTPKAPASAAGVAPADCKILSSDQGWPTTEIWKKAMPKVATRGNVKAGLAAPDYKVIATTAHEVQEAVKFAADHNIRLSVLNSGHDFLGRNDAPSGLRLTVGDIKGIRVSKSFTPTANGVPPVDNNSKAEKITFAPGEQAYVTFGVGMSTQMINDAIAPSNLFTLGAAHGEVATGGGWGQAAGHSPLGPRYGLGADVVVEYKLVTADGKLTIANEASNPDLFWALRGGGGGTYGVVTEATVKAFPSPKMTITTWFLNTTDYNDKKSIYAPAAYFHNQIPDLVEKSGASGYYYLFPNAIKSVFLTADKEANKDWAKKTWDPVLSKMASYPGINNKTLVVKYEDVPSYKVFFDAAFGSLEEMASMPGMGGMANNGGKGGIAGEGAGGAAPKNSETKPPPVPASSSASPGLGRRGEIPLYRKFFEEAGLTKRHGPEEKVAPEILPQGILPMDSRLLGAAHLKDARMAEVLEKAMPDMPMGQLRGNVVGGNKVFAGGNNTSVNPAWRKAYVHLIQTGQGRPDASALRALAPDTGAYSNEASSKQPNWKEGFWGANYARLSHIKTKYDPNGIFWVTPGINADHFAVNNGRVCRVAVAEQASYTRLAPENDNKNLAKGGDENADGPGFPLLWKNGTIVNAPNGGKPNHG